MQRLIIIAAIGTPAGLERLEERIGAAVENATMAGGIETLTTEVLDGAAAARAIAALGDAAAGRSRLPIDPAKRGIG